jgi:hypothetical protein
MTRDLIQAKKTSPRMEVKAAMAEPFTKDEKLICHLDPVLRTIWVFLAVDRPHGFPLEVVTTTTFPKRSLAPERFFHVQGQSAKLENGCHRSDCSVRHDDIISEHKKILA